MSESSMVTDFQWQIENMWNEQITTKWSLLSLTFSIVRRCCRNCHFESQMLVNSATMSWNLHCSTTVALTAFNTLWSCCLFCLCVRPKAQKLLELLFLLDFSFDLCIINPTTVLPSTYQCLYPYQYLFVLTYLYKIAADPGAGIGLIKCI